MVQMDVESMQTPDDLAAMGDTRFAVPALCTRDDLPHPLEFPCANLTPLAHAGQGRACRQHQLA